jgi:hypothetical protein
LAPRARIREDWFVTEDDEPKAAAEDEDSADAMFEALWSRVLEAWDDDKPHQAALSHALEKQLLPVIAGRYRQLIDDPEKGPRAKKKIDGIVIAATQMLMATKTPERTKLPWQWTASVAAVFFLVVAFLAYKILLRH